MIYQYALEKAKKDLRELKQLYSEQNIPDAFVYHLERAAHELEEATWYLSHATPPAKPEAQNAG